MKLKAFLHWLKYPVFRYTIQPTFWRSIWLHWGWVGFGFQRVRLNDPILGGVHHSVKLGFFMIAHSRNYGQFRK